MKISAKELSLISMFTALTAIGAFISFPVGPVPITLQSLFVILSGLVLGSKLGALSQLVYILLGLVGIPIFAGFTGGIQSIVSPGFGFIIGFVFASFLSGLIIESNFIKTDKRIWLAAFIGTITIYIFGLPYMYYILNGVLGKDLSFIQVFKMGCLLFLPGDTIKFIIASIVGSKLLKAIKADNLYISK